VREQRITVGSAVHDPAEEALVPGFLYMQVPTNANRFSPPLPTSPTSPISPTPPSTPRPPPRQQQCPPRPGSSSAGASGRWACPTHVAI
jgi:hypothetical protein